MWKTTTIYNINKSIFVCDKRNKDTYNEVIILNKSISHITNGYDNEFFTMRLYFNNNFIELQIPNNIILDYDEKFTSDQNNNDIYSEFCYTVHEFIEKYNFEKFDFDKEITIKSNGKEYIKLYYMDNYVDTDENETVYYLVIDIYSDEIKIITNLH